MEPSDVENLASNQRSKQNKQWDTKSFIQTNAISAPAIGRHLVFAIIHHAALVSIGLYTPTPPPPPPAARDSSQFIKYLLM